MKTSLTPAEALSLLYSTALKGVHPDTAHGVASPAEVSVLKVARDVLRPLVAPDLIEIPCVTCKGKGTVPARWGSLQCGTCKGTGVAP